MANISKRAVDAKLPTDTDAYLWDDELKGFGLKVTPAGRKVYLVQYRLGGRNGRTRRFTIGPHGKLTPDEARREAKRLLGEVSAGRDPMETKDETRATNSLGELLERFLTEHVDAKLKKTTAVEYKRLARLYVRPELRHRSITDVQRKDVARLHHKLLDKPYQANRSVALLSKFFNWCEKHGLRPDGSNPCRHVEKYNELKHERFLSEAELARLGEALALAEVERTASPWAIAAIRLLMLTGARLSEILTLKWDYVDIERASMRLPDSKTGAKTIYLNAPALEVLASVPRVEGNSYVICGEKAGAHLVNLQKPWRRIRRLADLEDLRIHDLRHSFASVAVAGGMSLPLIGALLGHSQPATTARYAHLSSDPLRTANEAIGRKISAATGRRHQSSNLMKSQND